MFFLIILVKEFVVFYIVMKEKIFLEIMGLYKVWKEFNENMITYDWKLVYLGGILSRCFCKMEGLNIMIK